MLSLDNIISIVTDEKSWINEFIPYFRDKIQNLGYKAELSHNHKDLKNHDIVIYLSYSKIVKKECLEKNKHNLVVHGSDLPKGKGWSPFSWEIAAGKNKLVLTLFEANEEVDAGVIYLKQNIVLSGSELVDEWRNIQTTKTFELVLSFIENYKETLLSAVEQKGPESFYRKRTLSDSELDINKTIKEQFNLLRVVDNKNYPAYFEIMGEKYEIHIYRQL